MISIAQLHDKSMPLTEVGSKAYIDASVLRKKTLKSYSEAGSFFLKIKDIIEQSGASRYNPVETDLGFKVTSFANYLEQVGLDRSTIYDYITLSKLWYLEPRVGLLEPCPTDLKKDSGYRLDCAVKILKWAEAKLEQDPKANVHHTKYWEDTKTSQPKSSNPTGLALQVAVLKKELSYYKSQCQDYKDLLADAKQQIEELKRQLQGMY